MTDSAPGPRRTTVTAPRPQGERSTAAPPSRDEAPRKRAVKDLLSVALMPLGGIATAQQIRYPDQISPFTLDVDTIATHADPLADAIVKVADAYPVVGTILDRMGQVAPISELVGAVVTIGFQLAENHGKLPVGLGGNIPGIRDRHEYAMSIANASGMKVSANGDSPSPE